MSLPELMQAASEVRDLHWGNVLTYSPKVFIPLTKLCRDVCHYCTFARPPKAGEPAFMTIDEVMEVARLGELAGCAEALFTLGDKPERRYKSAQQELRSLGFETTIEYLAHAAAAVASETRLVPHVNPGIMNAADLALLRGCSASMGMMLESISHRLAERGGPHYGSPDKDPSVRIATLEEAGRQRVPFTTGLLIGIGEDREERIATLDAIAAVHERFGHIQEVIVQNFRAKPNTPMASHPEPSADEVLETIALARILLPPEVSVQAPPNLAADEDILLKYMDAGLNDWGGVSPVTIDHVNPEAPWPHLDRLKAVCEARGFALAPRLCVYPRYLSKEWIDPQVMTKVNYLRDSHGLLRSGDWYAGAPMSPPKVTAPRPRLRERPEFERAFASVLDGKLTEEAIAALFTARGSEFDRVVAEADLLRRSVKGETVTFVVNRNINYTNMCYYKCGFCAFSKGPKSLNLRGDPYLLDFEEIAARTVEARSRGATEVCLQGGIHPSFTGDYYVGVLDAIKRAVPDIHIHAFSPLEVWQGAATKGVSLRDFLWELKDHGLATLPGTAAEILDDRIRAVICPDKITTSEWVAVARTAHSLDLQMTSTIMFGHADDFASWARHLMVLRNLQQETGGFTEFVPLPFVHMAAPIFLKGRSRRGPTFEEAILMHAVARLSLHPLITNIQVSWVKMGVSGAKAALRAGANDLGGTLMNETISRAAGASHGQELSPVEMTALGESIGRPVRQRNTVYGEIS